MTSAEQVLLARCGACLSRKITSAISLQPHRVELCSPSVTGVEIGIWMSTPTKTAYSVYRNQGAVRRKWMLDSQNLAVIILMP